MLIILCYPDVQVLENTLDTRLSRPDSAALSCPNSVRFWGRMRRVVTPAARLCPGFSTSCSTRLLENKRVVSKSRHRSMTMQATLDRATAARINPIISPVGQADTLANCVHLIRAIGYAVEGHDEAFCAQAFRLTDAVAAAMTFEAEGGSA